jgi:hypothetical protein
VLYGETLWCERIRRYGAAIYAADNGRTSFCGLLSRSKGARRHQAKVLEKPLKRDYGVLRTLGDEMIVQI